MEYRTQLLRPLKEWAIYSNLLTSLGVILAVNPQGRLLTCNCPGRQKGLKARKQRLIAKDLLSNVPAELALVCGMYIRALAAATLIKNYSHSLTTSRTGSMGLVD